MSQGYTRQYNSVVSGSFFSAASANSVGQATDVELNTIARAFHQSIGHSHDGTIGQGPKLDGNKAFLNLPDVSTIKTSLDTPLIKSQSGILNITPASVGNGVVGFTNHVSINAGGDFSSGFPSLNTNVGALNLCASLGVSGKTFISWNVDNTAVPSIQYGKVGVSVTRIASHVWSTFFISDLLRRDNNTTGTVANFSWQATNLGYDSVGLTPALTITPQDSQVDTLRLVADSGGGVTSLTSSKNLAFTILSPATTATTGFIIIPSMAGAPTGAPAFGTGACLTWDSTNHKLWTYDGTWRGVVLA